jgi:hypothetical protein
MVGLAHRPSLPAKLTPALLEIGNVGPIGIRELVLLVEAHVALENQ